MLDIVKESLENIEKYSDFEKYVNGGGYEKDTFEEMVKNRKIVDITGGVLDTKTGYTPWKLTNKGLTKTIETALSNYREELQDVYFEYLPIFVIGKKVYLELGVLLNK